MKKINLKKTLLLTAFAIFSTSATAPALSGGLQSELNELFGNMSNYTQPGVYESTRRGVLAGGGAQIRSRRMNIQLIAFEPPNIKAGCGGIDIFLGSFSYINLDQFISFLRAIAANAAGYAFQMALKVSCTICSNVMDAMQQIAQLMNNMNMSSCQLAQGIVEDSFDALQGKNDFKRTMDNITQGFSKDTVDDKGGSTQGQEKAYNSNPQKYAEEHLGNILWKAMTKRDVNAWFGLGPRDTTIRETLMSISGTVVLEKPKEGVNPLVFPTKPYPGGLITMRDLIEGSTRNGSGSTDAEGKMYSCDNDKIDCMNPKLDRSISLKGLAKTIEEELTKDDGIIFKYARDDGTLKFTEQQKAILSNMPAEAAVGFRNMALGSEESAESVAPYASRIIALSMTYSLMRELNGIIKQMAVGLSDEQAAVIKNMIADSEKRIDTEYQLLLTEYGTLSDLSNHIDNKLRNMEYPDPIHPKNPLVVTYPVN